MKKIIFYLLALSLLSAVSLLSVATAKGTANAKGSVNSNGGVNAKGSAGKRYSVYFQSGTGSESIQNTIEKNKKYNASQKLQGFKILIFSQTGNGSKDNAYRARNEFVSAFTDVIPSYLVYEEPYFKVKVGNFKSRREALGFLHIIKEVYPNAFIVPDAFDIDKYFSEEF